MIPPVTRTIYLPGSEPGGGAAHADEHLPGGDDEVPIASTGTAGLMSVAQATKLDGIAAGATVGSGYPAIVREIDYTAEANATLSDGDVTIASVTHTVQNVAQLSTCALVNGTGLRLRYKSTGTGAAVLSTSANTAGGVYALLSDLIPDHYESHRYLYLWHVTAAGTWDTGDDSVRFVLQSVAPSSGTLYEGVNQTASGGALYASVSASVNPHLAAVNSVTTAVLRYEMPASTYDVIGVRSDDGGDRCTIFAGEYDSEFPATDDLLLVGRTRSLSDTSGSQGYCQHNLAVTRAIVAVVGPSNPIGTEHGVDIHRLRILDLGV